jgi:hypothetical protein
LKSQRSGWSFQRQVWKIELEKPANITAYGWAQTEVTAVLGAIDAFLTARTAYEADNSTGKRLAKDEAKEEAVDAMRDFVNSSIRFNKRKRLSGKVFCVRRGRGVQRTPCIGINAAATDPANFLRINMCKT